MMLKLSQRVSGHCVMPIKIDTRWLILGVKTCQTHGWRKTKKAEEPRDH